MTDPVLSLPDLPGEVLIALLPVRIETRYVSDAAGAVALRVRIYPDDLAVDSHEPGLTALEREWVHHYRSAVAAATSQELQVAAWAQLAERFGPRRAAYLRAATTPGVPDPGGRAAAWTRAATCDVLPDRWLVLGYRGGERVLAKAGSEISAPLPMGPDPEKGSAVMAWMTDFETAVAVGMAVEIPFPLPLSEGLETLLVLGVRSETGANAVAGQDRLAQLFAAHRFTDGLSMPGPGTPTNNTPGAPAGYSSTDPGFRRSFEVETGQPLCVTGDASDGARLAAALGLSAEAFAHVENAGARRNETAQQTNAVLWPASWGSFLGDLLPGVEGSAIEIVRRHFVDWVRSEGPLPSLRIGRQPYGILPVLPIDAALDGLAEPPLAHLATIVSRLQRLWSAAGRPHGPTSSGADALRRNAAATTFRARGAFLIEADWFAHAVSFASQSHQILGERLAALPARAAQLDALVAGPDGAIVPRPWRLDVLTFPDPASADAGWDTAGRLRLAVADGVPAPAGYLGDLAGATLDELRAEAPTPARGTLLYLLVRHALITALTRAGLSALPAASTPAVRGGLGDRADDPAPDQLAELAAGLVGLSACPPDILEAVVAGTLDLATSRLDAWITSFATRRLAELRTAPGAAGGLLVGGYGVVLDLPAPPDAPPAEGDVIESAAGGRGFLHAPSLPQATTAAVLRSGYLRHLKRDKTDEFAIDLSSRRLRLAEYLLDGVRAGQSLGALLGYRLERALHDAGLDAYVAPLRQLAPVDPPLVPRPGGLDAAAHATDVVDGVALLAIRESSGLPWNEPVGGYQLGPSTPEAERALDGCAEALDAAHDALLAEGVHQTLMGNPTRAGAAYAVGSHAEATPAPLEFGRTPRTGIAASHRVIVLAPAAVTTPNGPREKAEPRLAGWARDLLGDLTAVVGAATFRDPASGNVRPAPPVPVRLADHGLSALDVVALATTPDELTRYLAYRLLADGTRPAGVAADDEVILDAPALEEVLELAKALSAVMTQGRELRPGDLGREDAAVDAAGLEARVAAARTDLSAVADGLSAAAGAVTEPSTDAQRAAVEDALVAAWFHGIAGALPGSGGTGSAADLLSHVDAVQAEIGRRLARAGGPIATGDRVDAARAAMTAIFGPGYAALPNVSLADPDELVRAVSRTESAGEPGQDADSFVARTGRVRPRVDTLLTAYAYSQAHGTGQTAGLHIGQLPISSTPARWVGLPPSAGTTVPAGRTGLIFVSTAPVAAPTVAGLLIDEWSEVIPNAVETTGLTFDYDAPGAAAPQTILLAVLPAGVGSRWSLAHLEAAVLDSIDQIRVRLADIADIDPVREVLPAIYLPTEAPNGVAPDRIFPVPAGYGEPTLASAPRVTSLSVNVFRQGTTTAVGVTGSDLGGATFAAGGDVTVSASAVSDLNASLTIAVDPNATVGGRALVISTPLGGVSTFAIKVTPRPQISGVGPNFRQGDGHGSDAVLVTAGGIGLAGPAAVSLEEFQVTREPSSTDTALVLRVLVPRLPPWVSDWDPTEPGGPLKPPLPPKRQNAVRTLTLRVTADDGTALTGSVQYTYGRYEREP